jgi:thioredoxin reductase
VSSPLNFHLEQYDGPLDLLLDLIRKQEINIYDIPIARITAQYLEYMQKAAETSMELSAEFVYMAATLIHIKSKLLLPKDPELAKLVGEDEDPRKELVDRLLEQISPFEPEMHFGQEVTVVNKRADGRFDVETAGGLQFDAGAIVIAGGVGSFQPRRLGVESADVFEGSQIFYRVTTAADFHGKRLVIFGGGDSALDWTLSLADKATSLTLVHRRAEFRAALRSASR